MKKKVLLAILIILVIGIFTSIYHIQTVGADSGFDTSYDSGGLGFGGSDWGSDSSGGSGSSDPVDFLLIPYMFWGPIGFAASLSKLSNKKIKKSKSIMFTILYILSMIMIIALEKVFASDFIWLFVMENIPYVGLIILIILGVINPSKPKQINIPTLDTKGIVDESFKIYKDLQTAWMNFDYDKIKELVSDEMYNMYIEQLETLKITNQQNIMDGITFIDGYITEYKKVNNKETIKVYLSVNCYDYIINTKNNMTVRGNKHRILTLSYILTFERNIEVVEYCPKCGAPLKDLTECEYCRSKVVNNTSKLIMTKKEIKSQK